MRQLRPSQCSKLHVSPDIILALARVFCSPAAAFRELTAPAPGL